MKKMRSRLFGMWLALLVLIGPGGAAYGQEGPSAPVYRIVGLGDSVTAGYQPGMTETSIPYGYTERLYEQALFHGRAKLDNYGIIGLRTAGLSRLLQGAAEGKSLKADDFEDFSKYPEAGRLKALADGIGARTAEMKANLAVADLVVITIGGNDFSDFLRELYGSPESDPAAAFDQKFAAILGKYAEEAEQVLRQVGALAPNARILISDQYLPMPKLAAPELYDMLYEKAVEPITEALDGLAAKLQGEGLMVEAVHVADSFKGKEGALTHMSRSFGRADQTKPDHHPTDEGYQAIAEDFAEAVWGKYRKLAPRPEGVPISVIVNGKELQTDNHPVIKPPGVTFVALRDISNATGAELLWDAAAKTATFKQNGREVSITIGAGTMTVNGAEQKLAIPAFMHTVGNEGKTYVPLAVIASGLGYEVIYRKELQAAFIQL